MAAADTQMRPPATRPTLGNWFFGVTIAAGLYVFAALTLVPFGVDAPYSVVVTAIGLVASHFADTERPSHRAIVNVFDFVFAVVALLGLASLLADHPVDQMLAVLDRYTAFISNTIYG